jgi:hypothetical protein
MLRRPARGESQPHHQPLAAMLYVLAIQTANKKFCSFRPAFIPSFPFHSPGSGRQWRRVMEGAGDEDDLADVTVYELSVLVNDFLEGHGMSKTAASLRR